MTKKCNGLYVETKHFVYYIAVHYNEGRLCITNRIKRVKTFKPMTL